jgi:hypothetical protein
MRSCVLAVCVVFTVCLCMGFFFLGVRVRVFFLEMNIAPLAPNSGLADTGAGTDGLGGVCVCVVCVCVCPLSFFFFVCSL